jgi:N-methylhydantoinase A
MTCVRSLDVRVAGVAGGSLFRVGKRMGRTKLLDVGPRSAHIAGLPYACFASQDDILDSVPRLIAPKPGDPAEYLVLETKRDRRIALTLTCAANALGTVASGSYAEGDGASARVAFEIAARRLGVSGEVLAKSALAAATDKLTRLVRETADEQEMRNPVIVGVGGGAGAVIPALAECIGSEWEIPEEAEIISSIGDALSVVRVEIERTLPRPSAHAIAQVHHEAEAAALRAGASPASVRLESTSVPERGALRVTAFGAVALEAGAPAGVPNQSNLTQIACAELGPAVQLVFQSEFFSVFCTGAGENRDFVVIDRSGAVSVKGKGRALAGQGSEVAAALEERIPELVRHYGPISVAPAVRFVRGSSLVDLTLISSPAEVRQAVLAECAVANNEQVVALLSRS